jgi:hypothetical protein
VQNKYELLSDPLSEVTRKERRMLLGVSMLGIAFVKMGIAPTKISSLGIEFANTESTVLFKVLGLMVTYFVAAFILYAFTDLLRWLKVIKDNQESDLKEEFEEWSNHDGQLPDRFHDELMGIRSKWRFIHKYSPPTAYFRGLFDFILPLLVGVYSATILFLSA